jgi:hypothetical protein
MDQTFQKDYPHPNYNFIDRSHKVVWQGQYFSISKILGLLNTSGCQNLHCCVNFTFFLFLKTFFLFIILTCISTLESINILWVLYIVWCWCFGFNTDLVVDNDIFVFLNLDIIITLSQICIKKLLFLNRYTNKDHLC